MLLHPRLLQAAQRWAWRLRELRAVPGHSGSHGNDSRQGSRKGNVVVGALQAKQPLASSPGNLSEVERQAAHCPSDGRAPLIPAPARRTFPTLWSAHTSFQKRTHNSNARKLTSADSDSNTWRQVYFLTCSLSYAFANAAVLPVRRINRTEIQVNLKS